MMHLATRWVISKTASMNSTMAGLFQRWISRCSQPALLSAVLCVSASAFPDTTLHDPNVVATIGATQIPYKEFTDRYEDYLVFSGVQDNMRARFAVLNNMINEILLKQYDDNSKIYNDPEYKKEIAWARKESVLAFLKDQEIYAKIRVSDEEVHEAYRRSKVKVSVRHLFAQTEGEAENLYRLAKMGVSFKELAQQVFTDTALKNNGGSLGFISWGQTDPNFENAAYSLKVGEISRPVKTAQGYSIIKVDDRIEDPFTTETDFLNMKRKIERALKIDKKVPYEKDYMAKVFDTTAVKFDETATKAVCDDLQEIQGHSIESTKPRSRAGRFCVKYKNRSYSAQEIENKILQVPAYNRSLISEVHQLKAAVIGLLMQDVLLDIAKQKGYDTTSYVNETFEKLANNIYLNYKRNEVLALVPVADSEITKYYTKNIGYYTNEQEMNVQEIVVGNDSLAFALRADIQLGADFGSLASKYSLRSWSAKHNGEMGLAPISKFGGLKDTLWAAPLGELLGPLKFDKYYGLFRVLEKEGGKPIDVASVRPQIVKAIQNEKGFPYMKDRLENLSKLTTIRVNETLVKNYTMSVAG